MTLGTRAAHWTSVAFLAAVLAGFWIVHVHLAPPPPAPHSIHDITRYFHPSMVYMHDEYRAGRLPLWNPHQMAGMPFLATHIAGPLYPPNVILLMLLAPARAIEAHAVLHLLLAGVFSALFLRRLGLGLAASLAGATAYMLSGALLALFYSVAYVSTCTWLPAVLWATHGLVNEGRPRWALFLAGALAFAFLGGHAQAFLYEAQLGAAWAVVALVLGPRPAGSARVLGLAIASGAVLLGLVSVQLLPTLEMLENVPRAVQGLSVEEAGDFGILPDELLSGLRGAGTRFAVTLFSLPLLVLGLFDRSRRREWSFFAVAALLAGLFALGSRTPVFALYYALPAGDLFRFPYRVDFVYAFCVSVLVGIGVQGAETLARRWRPGDARIPAVVGAILAGAVAVELAAPGRLKHALPVPPPETRGVPAELLGTLEKRWGEGRVFIENFGNYHTSELPYLLGMMNGGFVVPTYEPMVPGAYADYFGQGRLWRGFVNVVPVTPLFSWTRTTRVSDFAEGGLARLLDLMSVRYYVAHDGHAKRRFRELRAVAGGAVERRGPTRVVERASALPRAYVVYRQRVEPDPERARRLVQMPRFDPHRAVVVAEEIPGVSDEPRGLGGERASVRSYAGEEVVIDARCRADCLLVLTDLDHPGWEAEVDGEPAAIHRVNGLFRAVRLPAGEHRVVQRYRPRSFRLGAAISLGTVAFLCAAGVAFLARRRRAAV